MIQVPHIAPTFPRKAIYLNIKGGLGNQLFQAAFGIVLREVFGARLGFLTEDFKRDTYGRVPMLGHFPVLQEILAASPVPRQPVIFQESTATTPEQAIVGLAEVLQANDEVVLDGYWQNPVLHRGFETLVKTAVTPAPPLGAAQDVSRIAQAGAIGVHIRRSDYGHHGLVRAAYYSEAIQHIRSARGNMTPVLVFTDEPNFSAYILREIPNAQVVRGDPTAPIEDFARLCACRDFVIANSSFSWWAATIGGTSASIVISPQPWCLIDPHLDPAQGHWISVPNSVYAP